MKVAMPSPKGTNHARLYIDLGMAMDAAPPERRLLSKKMADKMYSWFEENHDKETADAFWEAILRPRDDEPEAEDDVEKTEIYASESVQREAVRDHLPVYKPNGFTENDLANPGRANDSRPLRLDELTRHTRIGAIY